MKICFATNNLHKVEEVRAALPDQVELVTLNQINCDEDLPETSPTLEGNALQKANYVLLKYGIPCFADDTGLEVDALNGAPGVYSARYAGEHKDSDDNIKLLLQNLQPLPNRKAKFRTVFCLVGFEEQPIYFEGEVSGTILPERRGSSGFGYDPVFQPDGYSITFAEMTLAQKNMLSHRARATKKLVEYLSRI